MAEVTNEALRIIQDESLTYEQIVNSLAKNAENTINVLNKPKELLDLIDKKVICDLYEGNAPFRPRYIVPDYEKFMKNGSEFLNLSPASDIHEAINNLIILYRHVPSITTFPVYIGNIDKLLLPFVKDEEEAYSAIKRFLTYIDRTITDSFCHGNIGPEDNIAARLILKAERELSNSIPNITLKYDMEKTSDDFAIDCINTAFKVAKPSFANHKMFSLELGENYAIASCYNGLNIGGGSYTLTRINLKKLSDLYDNLDDFLNEGIAKSVDVMATYMDERIKFLVEETHFFNKNFLVKEGLIDIENFTAMFGMVGLAEAVNKYMENDKKFGHCEESNTLGIKIMDKLQEEVNKKENKYLYASKGKYLLHAQVGIDDDTDTSPGTRIPVLEEPTIENQVIMSAPFHKYFPTGTGDIFNFDVSVKNNPTYVLDIIKGAFNIGMRYFSHYLSDVDVVRITGYLVKKSDIEKLRNKSQVLNGAAVLGKGASEGSKALDRKVNY